MKSDNTANKRKKVSDVEAELGQKIAELSSPMETLTNQIEKLEARVAFLETNLLARLENLEKQMRESSPQLSLASKARGSLSIFWQQTVYPSLKHGSRQCGKQIWRGILMSKNLAKIAVTVWGYKRIAIAGSIILAFFALFLLRPWRAEPSPKIISQEQNAPATSQETYNSKPVVVGGKVTDQILAEMQTKKEKETYALEKVEKKESLATAASMPLEKVAFSTSPSAQDQDLPLVTKWIQASEIGDKDTRMQAMEELGKLGSEGAAKHLTKLLKDSNGDIRWAAIRNLNSTRGYKPAAQALNELIQNPKEDIAYRREALRTLANIGSVSDTQMLLAILLDKTADEEMRANAAYALSTVGDAVVSRKLVPLLQDSASLVRQMTAYTLGVFLYPHATEQLIEVAQKDENFDVRITAIQALGRIPHQAQVIGDALFQQWKKEKDEAVRREIADTLRKMMKGTFPKELKKQIETYLPE